MISQGAFHTFAFSVAAFGVLALSLFVSFPASAQVTGATISGTVKDTSGAVVPNAKIALKNTATGITRQAVSDASGFYSAPNLSPGSYEVITSAPGFSTQTRTGVVLGVAATPVLDISLKPGALTEKVEVTASIPGVQLSTSSLAAEVNSTTVRELPLNGRDWTLLATLQPGVIAIRTQAVVNSTSNRGNRGFGNELSDSGHTPYQNNYRINGISVNDYSNGSPGSVLGVQLGVDGIQEFSVLTANYSSEYGRASGAIINAITRSGTNQFHGSAYGFLRDKVLDARNFFDGPTVPPFHRAQYGASGGGPIRKDKSFIFVDYEGVRQNLSQTLHDTVPTAAARAGNLCSVPQTGCTPSTVIVDAKVKPFLDFYPLPNAGLVSGANGDTGFFNGSGLARLSENYLTAKIDHKITDTNSLAASWLYDRSKIVLPDALLVGNSQSQTLRLMASVEWTHVISPTAVNTARIGYSRSQALNADPESAISPLASSTSLGAFPGRGAPILTVTGLTTMQGALGALTVNHHRLNSYQAYDDLFLTRGHHSLKVGFAVENMRYGILSSQQANGGFSFTSLQSFLTNQPTSFVGLAPTFPLYSVGFRQTIFAGYVQDDWRIRPNLTFNGGLRYEPTTLPAEAHGRFGVMKDFYNGGVTTGVSSLWETNATLRNFAPRVGFSWDPFSTGKTAVRGGFGIYDVLPLSWALAQLVAPNYPFGLFVTGSSLATGSFPTGAVTSLPLNPSSSVGTFLDQHPGASYSMNWNLNIQREIMRNLTATVGYVGSRSIHLPWKLQDQDMVLPTLTPAGYLWPCNKAFNPCTGRGTKLNTSVSGIAAELFDAAGSYHALQVGVIKKMSYGFQAQGAYTWGKCMDTSSTSVATNTFDNTARDIPFFAPTLRRGLCDYSLAHVFVGNTIWQVPSAKVGGAVGEHILGGWELGGVVTLSAGSPFSLKISGNPLGQNSSDNLDFPDRLWGTPGCDNPTNPGSTNYLKLNCFTPPVAPASFAAQCQPAAASVAAVIANTCMNLFGNNGRNTLIGPGLFNVDLAVFKNNYFPKISESFNIQFRAEFFNVLNHANFQSPLNNNTLFTATGTSVGGAGAIDTTTTPARQIQLGLKVIF